jgi:hypothetical protein
VLLAAVVIQNISLFMPDPGGTSRDAIQRWLIPFAKGNGKVFQDGLIDTVLPKR